MGDERKVVKICAVGYGKLGGFELGYASDLDLVFLHDSGAEQAETDAAKAVDNQVFFIRFAQRTLHILTMHSAAGRLYEVDVRLRPSGKGGMLITRVGAFVEYQEKEAWTWEHQALLHARAVAGELDLRGEFERVRVDMLMRCVRRDTLRGEVRNMRERMRRELSRAKAGAGQFDIKQDPGGTADIEFLAQYWALLHAATHPPVIILRTPSANSNRWPRPIWCRRPRWTCSPTPIASIGSVRITCPWSPRNRWCRARNSGKPAPP